MFDNNNNNSNGNIGGGGFNSYNNNNNNNSNSNELLPLVSEEFDYSRSPPYINNNNFNNNSNIHGFKKRDDSFSSLLNLNNNNYNNSNNYNNNNNSNNNNNNYNNNFSNNNGNNNNNSETIKRSKSTPFLNLMNTQTVSSTTTTTTTLPNSTTGSVGGSGSGNRIPNRVFQFYLQQQYQHHQQNQQNQQQQSQQPQQQNISSPTPSPLSPTSNNLYNNIFNSSVAAATTNSNSISQQQKEDFINQINFILNEIEALKKKVKELEEEQRLESKNTWGLKYARRVLITSNFLLGIWVSISRILMYIGKQKKSRLLHVVVPSLGQKETRNHISLLLLEAISNAARKSWIFFISSFLLSRSTAWKRQTGLFFCTLYSLYLAFFPQYLPWTNYFNIFASLLYITAAWSSAKSGSSFREIFNLL